MQRLAGAAALLLAAALAVSLPPAAAQQLPAGPLQLPGPDRAAAGTAAAAAGQAQLSRFVEPQPAGPAAEPAAALGGRRSVQAEAAAAGGEEPAQLPANAVPPAQVMQQAAEPASPLAQPASSHDLAQHRVRPVSRRLDEHQQQQVAGPLTLPGPGQRFSGAGQMVNQQVAAGDSPAVEHSTAPSSPAAVPAGSNTRRRLAASPLAEVALVQGERAPSESQPVAAAAAAAPATEQPEVEEAAAVAAAPAAEQPEEAAAAAAAAPVPEQPVSPFVPIPVPAVAVQTPPAAEEAATQEQPPAAEVATAEEQPSFEPLFPGVTLATAPATELLPESAAAAAPATTEVPGLGSEAGILSQAELALSVPGGNETAPAFPAIGAAPGAEAAQQAQQQPGQPGQRTNFTSLISLLDPPATFQVPPLSPQQQANLPKLKQLRQGTGTVSVQRNVGNFGGTQMACGMGYLSDYFKDHFVALPTTLYRSGELCGACVRLWCVDSICEDALVRNASFMITDSCKECTGNNILVSERGFANLTGVNVNISPMLQVAWTFESCAPLIQGGIKMLASKNNGPTFLSYNLSNLKQLLREVTIGGIPFTRTAYGAWELNSPGRDITIPNTGAEIVLTSVDGQRISRRLRSLGSQDLGINFA